VQEVAPKAYGGDVEPFWRSSTSASKGQFFFFGHLEFRSDYCDWLFEIVLAVDVCGTSCGYAV
jgi:hypothetical protein